MPLHAAIRSTRTRRLRAGGAVALGSFALACTVGLGTAHAADAAPATTVTKTQSTARTSYTVQSGDHLIAIARTLNVPGGWQAIASANNLSSPYTIYPGQVLKLPAGTTAKTASSSASSSSASKAATASKASTSSSASSSASTSASSSGVKTYANNLDGWIKESLDVMAKHNIPGSYNGIYRNVIRESSGNPKAINLWDSNAAKGIPSKGLLQVIQPTFNAYHVSGTSWDIYDPIANITAACNYAYHRYGSIDNVNGPY
ncbi:LysM peptidoglycan-binding domain-containing protein [Streptomyces nodosus]|uniref:LysM peptidoglycan-binding domain-containing protein n=1 Tax=Streptomyces nodosus TaxID=40318 RepID=UPI0034550E1B